MDDALYIWLIVTVFPLVFGPLLFLSGYIFSHLHGYFRSGNNSRCCGFLSVLSSALPYLELF